MLRVYSIYDNEKQEFSHPFFTGANSDFEKEDVEALRIFKAQLFDRHNLIALFPDKFDLYFIGWFDESDGSFVYVENDSKPKAIINGNDAVKEMQNESEKN